MKRVDISAHSAVFVDEASDARATLSMSWRCDCSFSAMHMMRSAPSLIIESNCSSAAGGGSAPDHC